MSDQTHSGGGAPPAAPVDALLTGDDDRGRFAEHLSIAAKNPSRVELLIGFCFVAAILGVLVLGAVYVQGGNAQAEGACLIAIFGGIGVGMAAWGKYLMPKGPFMEEREVLTSQESEEKFAASFRRGAIAIEGRRSFLLKLMMGAMAAMGAILLFPLRSLTDKGPKAGTSLYTTGWFKGSLLLREDGTPVHLSDMDVGGALTVFPENSTDPENDQTMLIRPASVPVGPPDKRSWSPAGFLAFSKVCTHAGCPVGQYEAQYQKLLCPCHESTFDVLNACSVVFGPAPRPLPQLPLTVDSSGYLRAAASYGEPIGPGFWSRDGRS